MTTEREVQLEGVVANIEDVENAAATPGKEQAQDSRIPPWLRTLLRIFSLFLCLYCFLLGLDIMGVAFKALGGKGAGKLFSITDNPITGLMVGVLATVLVQSSSTSTSIVVGLVGAEQLSVHNAIPIIMGANIGTSVTNTIVSMGHLGERLELERAFAGATVHDVFNMLSVIVLLPLEVVVGAINGHGGPIYWLSKVVTDALMGGSGAEATFTSPTKAIVDPLAEAIMHKNKYVIKALSLGAPAAVPVPGAADTEVFCVSDAMVSVWKHIDESACLALQTCQQQVAAAVACSPDSSCLLHADEFYLEHVEHGQILEGGLLMAAGDLGGGIIGLLISLVLICGSLFVLVKLLHELIMGSARRIIMKATHMNDYLAMLVGAVLTFIVQSSSVVTSALTPLCGIGVLPVHKMLPMTLGANIGTTFTSILAALSVLKASSLQIAFCHLFFNILGISVWFPVPFMRRVVINAACLLGLYASFWRVVPLLYILVMFLAVPGIALGISLLFGASLVAGVVLLVVALGLLAGLIVWWNYFGGCYRVVSLGQREARLLELKQEEEAAGVAACPCQGDEAVAEERKPEEDDRPAETAEIETEVRV